MVEEADYAVDVVIVGGGPAGAAAAFTLGKQGLETILIDRKTRDKIGDKTCGDALSPNYTKEANKLVGLPIPKQENGELMEYCDAAILVGITPGNQLYLGSESATVDRLKYGQALINALDEFGHVKVIPETKLKSVLVKNKFVEGIEVYNRKKGTYKIFAKIVMDASGSSGVVRSRLPEEMCTKFPRKIPRDQMIVAYREIIRVPEEHAFQKGIYLTYEPEIKMPGYYWVFSRGPKELNIGLGWMIYEKNRGGNIREINDIIRKRKFPNAEILRSDGDQIPARLPIPSCVHNGFIAVGDAAALANPLNGEGHGPALMSGIQAAKIIQKVIEKGEPTEKRLWDYNKWVWKNYGVEFSWGIAVVKFLDKYGIETFDWLMSKGILKEDDILSMINDHENTDLGIVKRALKGIYRPRVLLGLRSIIQLAEEIQIHSKNYPEPEDFAPWLKRLNELENSSV